MPNESMGPDFAVMAPKKIPYILPDNMALHPYMDIDVVFGIPLWVWVMAAMFVVFVGIAIRWYLRYRAMRPVQGYRDCATSMESEDQQVWYFGKNKSFNIFCLRARDGILQFHDHIARLEKWIQKSMDSAGSCGGLPMMIVSDSHHSTKDPIAEMAMCIACEEFNANNKLDKDGNPRYDETGYPKHIRNHEDYLYFRPVLEKLNPNGVNIPTIFNYNPAINQKYAPPGPTAKFFGARLLQEARGLKTDTGDSNSLMDKFGLLILAVVLDVVALIFAYLMVKG